MYNQYSGASQILICNNNITFEDIDLFIHRCCHHAKYNWVYCLVLPEKLQSSVHNELLNCIAHFDEGITEFKAYFRYITVKNTGSLYDNLKIYQSELDTLFKKK